MIIRLETGETTIPGVGCMVYGVGWLPTVVRIRLSQPPAGDWLAGAWAELGNTHIMTHTRQQTNAKSALEKQLLINHLHLPRLFFSDFLYFTQQ